jgi:hypothetical protein
VHKDLKFSTSKTPFNYARLSTDPFDGRTQFMMEMRQIETAEIAALDPLQVCPEALSRVQLRGIGGQTLHVESRRRPIGQVILDDVAAVNRRSIPEDDHTAGHLTQEMFQKGDHILRIDWAVLAGEIQLPLWGDRADGREMIAGPPLPQDGRVSHWGIGADDTGQGIESGLVDEEDGLLLDLRPFLRAGQVS